MNAIAPTATMASAAAPMRSAPEPELGVGTGVSCTATALGDADWLAVSGAVEGVAGGVALVLVVLDSAVRTLVLPRGSVVALSRAIWLITRRVFDLIAGRCKTYEARDRVMALYAPMALLLLPVVWLAMILGGFTMVFHALGVSSWQTAFVESGSSLFTLGFVRPRDVPTSALAFLDAALGLGVVALFVAYLPSIYSAFSRREVLVAMLSARAGTPPSAIEFLIRTSRIDELQRLNEVWERFQQWFAEIEETHTSQAALVFFRSPRNDRSWVTAAGVVMDAAALSNSTRNPSPMVRIKRPPCSAILGSIKSFV